MTREDIIRMAREAGFDSAHLTRFAELVFEQGRQQGMRQERALWELSRIGQEIEAEPEQEPVAKKKHEPKIDLGKYAGTYGGYTTPEPSEGYLQKAYRLANELRSHLSIAPPQRPWVGLTEDEVAQAMYRADAIFTGPMQFKFAKELEAKLKGKNFD